MAQLTNNYTIRFSDEQMRTIETLVKYDVCISKFIRQAIKEKIQRDWKQIKINYEQIKYPF